MTAFGTLVAPGEVRFERLLPGPIERVWDYLTDPERRARWLAGGAMEPRVGGAVELRFRHQDLSPVIVPTPERFAARPPDRRHVGQRGGLAARLRPDGGSVAHAVAALRPGAWAFCAVAETPLGGAASMAFTIEPVAFVSAPRATPEDDDRGGQVVEIRLAPGMDASSIHGLVAFSHVEVLFVLHEVDTAKVVTGARHPRNHPA